MSKGTFPLIFNNLHSDQSYLIIFSPTRLHRIMNTDPDDEVDINARIIITTNGGKLSKDEDNLIVIETHRRRVSQTDRKIIWESTKGC